MVFIKCILKIRISFRGDNNGLSLSRGRRKRNRRGSRKRIRGLESHSGNLQAILLKRDRIERTRKKNGRGRERRGGRGEERVSRKNATKGETSGSEDAHHLLVDLHI